ncbi:MAG TPA: ATP-dependent DNA helicase RecG [Streptosporangiaceae bacterium]|jgi:ATP-dependent DNA helicase RecG|nr:ATP-dependent DNA helicase RecG [Streptosporangiaceae bacterium]
MASMTEPLTRVLGGKAAAKAEQAFGLRTTGDLLRHYPRRYVQRGELTDLASLRDGEHVTVFAQVAKVTSHRMRNRKGKLLEVTVTDGSAQLKLAFFNKVEFWERQLSPGRHGMFAGRVSTFNGKRQLAHPECKLLGADEADKAAEFAAELIPVYPASKDLSSWDIEKCVRLVLDTLGEVDDPLPAAVRERHNLAGLATALQSIHRPADLAEASRARTRLKWDEAFVLQAVLAQRRRAAEALPATARPLRPGGLLAAFDTRLPFSLTDGQREAGGTIAADLALSHPMHRLLQGEVGSGKTVIAVRAMLQVIDAGGQAALLAPTEVLAQQHYRSVSELLGPLGQAGRLGGAEQATRLALLTGSQGAAARREALLDAASGAAGIVIGTHALLTEHVQFADLGLVVIDEQHRFGVEQRDALREKGRGARPHVLVMTATPIPRTVAMTVFGDLDTSTLTELPAGRAPIASHVVPAADKPHYLTRAWQRIREEAGRGGQAYVVCPRIGDDPGPSASSTDGSHAPAADAEAGLLLDEDEDGESPRRPPLAVLDLAPGLAEGALAGLRLRVLHGRLPAEEKDATMRAFADGQVDVLVTTTVVEVGVDVPNATAMVIMDADRFGVSQLHQLRGRVGRGGKPGLCLLVTEAPAGSKARERLAAVAATVDGFELARLDLEQRREGDVLGAAQAGRKRSLKLLTLLTDEALIGQAREEAASLVAADPELAGHPALAAAIGTLVDAEQAEFLEKA